MTERQTPQQARLSLSRALLLSIPIATVAFFPLDIISGAAQTLSLTLARVILIVSFSAAAWRLPRMDARSVRHTFLALSFALSLAMALLCHGTGGVQSPGFGFMWALPLVVGLLFMHEPICPLISGLSSLPLGAWLLMTAGKSSAEMAYWLAVTIVATGLATTASIFYRRLQRLEIWHQTSSEKRLAHNDRLSSLGGLAAGMAHEMNSPLASIAANLTFLAETLVNHPDADARDALSESQLATRRIEALVRDLLSFSRTEQPTGEVGSCNLQRQIEISLSLAKAQLRGRTEAVTEFGAGLEVKGAGMRIGQIFLNLILNAVQAMPAEREGNRIKIVTGVAPDGRVVAQVHDNGLGIAPDVVPRIFDPFFTTKGIGLGTGLGLSICHGLLQEIGGSIEVESELGKGTLFRIFLQPATA